MDPIQQVIFKRTLNSPAGGMIGAPEVLQLGQNLIHLIQAKKAIDIGLELKPLVLGANKALLSLEIQIFQTFRIILETNRLPMFQKLFVKKKLSFLPQISCRTSLQSSSCCVQLG